MPNVRLSDAKVENDTDAAFMRIQKCMEQRSPALDLSGLGLKHWPRELFELTWLKSLAIRNNELSTIPSNIKRLSSLEQLDLDGNLLRELPEHLSSLSSLFSLGVGTNRLTAPPNVVTKLPMLRRLKLSVNPIRSLPKGLGKLKNLEWLAVYGCDLDEFPVELCELENLRFLIIFHNKITAIPQQIGQLTKLQRLDLFSNRLTSLPSEMSELKNVEELDLGANPFAQVPPQIRGMASIERLFLRRMSLKALPSWLNELSHLRALLLHENPGLKLSPSVLGSPPSATKPGGTVSAKSILDFYFGRLSGETRPLNEVKLILVGRGGAGKTSTVRALQGFPFNEDESSTPGIALTDWKMSECKGEAVTAHVWDFAGQVITHALHQFFFSVRSVYVLVLTGRENNERDDAEYWLRLIKAFGTDDKGMGPPVVVVLNKWDVHGCRPKVDREALKDRYPFIRGFVEMDCKSGKGVPKLKKSLCNEVERLKWVREPFPKAWDNVRRALARGRGRKAHLTYAQFRQLCVEQGVVDKGKQDSLAEILHNLGVALNYRNDPRLREATVLQPEWLTKNVYSLVRRAEKQGGVLKQPDIDSVLRYERDESMRAYLLRIMERFEIAYLPRAGHGQWLIPQALPDVQIKGAGSFRDAADATRLRYIYQALPEGLVARAIVRLSEFIEEVAGRKSQWASGVVLTRDGARALIRAEPQDRQVLITVTGPTKARQQLAGLCQAEMRDIHSEIRGLDPAEETLVEGTWVSTTTLELDEQNRRQTGISTNDRGTVLVDPAVPNNAFTEKLARTDQWKPTVFISYSKSDVVQRKQLELQLKILMNEGLIGQVWHDRMIDPGDNWDETIQRQLHEADIIIILVSTASLATDYITAHEIPQALALHARGDASVIPVILSACRWQNTQLSTLNALPEKGNPLNKWKPPADGWKSVADGIALVCEKLMTRLLEPPPKLVEHR